MADFGLATWDTTKGHKHNLGTEGFFAPEVLRHGRDASTPPQPYGTKCDMWSAGMVFGGLLFAIEEHCTEEFHPSIFRELSQHLPRPTASLLRKLLRRDPNKRLSAKQALNHRYFSTEIVRPILA